MPFEALLLCFSILVLGCSGREWAVEFGNGVTDLHELALAHDVVYSGPVSEAISHFHLFRSAKAEPTKFVNYLNSQGGSGKPSIIKFYEQIPQAHTSRSFTVEGEQVEEKKRLVVTDPSYPTQWHLHQYSNLAANSHVNAPGAWALGYLGGGITIGYVDDGVEFGHPDLAENFRPALSHNFVFNNNAYGPSGDWDVQGTSLAGLGSARDDGVACGVGVAPRSGIAALTLLQGRTMFTDAQEAAALSYKNNDISIYNNGWGPNAPGWNGQVNKRPGPLTDAAINASIHHGRGGLGNIYVWAGGNDHGKGDSCNYDGYVNSRETILVGATGADGEDTPYSEHCDAVLVVAPGASRGTGIVTTDLSGRRGWNPNANCTTIDRGIAGTSPAATIVSGIVALMLTANPKLNWLDVQYCLVASAVKVDPLDELWEQNGVGRWFNPKFGFGLVNAQKAVQEAVNRRNSHVKEHHIELAHTTSVPFHNEGGLLKASISLPCSTMVQIHHVEVEVWTDHPKISGHTIAIRSPAGTLSVLASPHQDDNSRWNGWSFLTNRFWGEKSYGDWEFLMADTNLQQSGNHITRVVFNLYGDGK